MSNAALCIAVDFSEELECPVCLDAWRVPVEVLPCGHIYCQDCLGSLQDKLCAVCRDKITSTRSPNRTLVNLSLNVMTKCQNCGWTGRREASFSHSCKAEDVERHRQQGSEENNEVREKEEVNQSGRGGTGGAAATLSLARGSSMWRSKVDSIRRSQGKCLPGTSGGVLNTLPSPTPGNMDPGVVTSMSPQPSASSGAEHLMGSASLSVSNSAAVNRTPSQGQGSAAFPTSSFTLSPPSHHSASTSTNSYDTNALMAYLFSTPENEGKNRSAPVGRANSAAQGPGSGVPPGRNPATSPSATAVAPSVSTPFPLTSSAVFPPTKKHGKESTTTAAHTQPSDQSNPYGLTPKEIQAQQALMNYYQQQRSQNLSNPIHSASQSQSGMANGISTPSQTSLGSPNAVSRRNLNIPSSRVSEPSGHSAETNNGEWPWTPCSYVRASTSTAVQSPSPRQSVPSISSGGNSCPSYRYAVIQPSPQHPKPWTFYHLTQEEYDQIVSLFVFFDTDESGDLNRQELSRLARWLNFARTDQEVDLIFASMDLSGTGSLSMAEFLTWLRYNKPNPQVLYGLTQAQYNTIMMQFQLYDLDQDGLLNAQDFVRLVTHLGDVRRAEEGFRLFSLVDATRRGAINLHEFLLFRANRQRRR